MQSRRKILVFSILGTVILFGPWLLSAARTEKESVRAVPEKMNPGFQSIRAVDAESYLEFVSADELEGRDTPSKGQTIARHYIQSLYKSWGVAPLGDSAGSGRAYEQRIPMIVKTYGQDTSLEIVSPQVVQRYTAERDFSFIMGADFEGLIEGAAVFAGYGISAPDLGYDDFAGIDVRNKIVVVAAGKPGGDRQDSLFNSPKHWARFEGRRTPAENCARLLAKKGALALIIADDSMDRFVSPHGYLRGGRIMSAGNRVFSPPLSAVDPMVPSFWASTRVVEAAFGMVQKSYSEAVKKIDAALKPASFDIPGLIIKLSLEMEQKVSACANLIGLIEGSDPKLKNEYVVIGAHLDHVGMNKEGYVFHGADDNGSGSVGVLQLAKALAINPEKPKRSIIVAHWTGEEKGLVGSRYFLKFPPVPLKDIAAYINLDMISHNSSLKEIQGEAKTFHLRQEDIDRISDEPEKLLMAFVSLPSPSFADLISSTNEAYVGLKVVPLLSFPMMGNSDHYFFCLEKIPSVFFFAGGNEATHQPTDTADRMNSKKMAEVVKLAYLLAFSVADEPQRPVWKD